MRRVGCGKIRKVLAGLALVLGLGVGSAESVAKEPLTEEQKAERKAKRYHATHDEEDGQFDISNALAGRYGFLPVPVIITEPALGGGAGLNLMYFIPPKKGKEAQVGFPSFVGVTGAGTFNGTWGVVGYYFGFLKDNQIRLKVATGYSSFNIGYFFDFGGGQELDFNFQGYFLAGEATFRLGKSPVYIGPKWVLVINQQSIEGVGTEPIDSSASIQGLNLTVDTRDTFFTPSRGTHTQINTTFNAPLGDQTSYWNVSISSANYIPVGKVLAFGTRGYFSTAIANTRLPAYGKPSIEMRGVPRNRYQGNTILQTEVELRFHVTPRWDLVPFGGVGGTFNERVVRDGLTADLIWSAGGGFRYQIARKLGLSVGLDVAGSNEDWAVYTVVGTAWR